MNVLDERTDLCLWFRCSGSAQAEFAEGIFRLLGECVEASVGLSSYKQKYTVRRGVSDHCADVKLLL